MIADRLLLSMRDGYLNPALANNFAAGPEAFPLADGYATSHWNSHISRVADISSLVKNHEAFFDLDPRSPLRLEWLYRSSHSLSGIGGGVTCEAPLLNVACVLDLEDLARHTLGRFDGTSEKEKRSRQGYESTPLHLATKHGNLSMIQMFSEAVYSVDSYGYTPLHYAILFDVPSAVFKVLAASTTGSAELERQRANPGHCVNPLFTAAQKGRADICRLLIKEHGWDPEARESVTGKSAVDFAIYHQHWLTANILATQLGARCAQHADCLWWMMGASDGNAFIQYLPLAARDWGLDVNATVWNGWNVLQRWLRSDKLRGFSFTDRQKIETALAHGVDANHRDNRGRATTHLLATFPDFPEFSVKNGLLRLLLHKSSNNNIYNDNDSNNSNNQISINATDATGKTLLHVYLSETWGPVNDEYDYSEVRPLRELEKIELNCEACAFIPAMVKQVLDLGLDRNLRCDHGDSLIDLVHRLKASYLPPVGSGSDSRGHITNLEDNGENESSSSLSSSQGLSPVLRQKFNRVMRDVINLLGNYQTVPAVVGLS